MPFANDPPDAHPSDHDIDLFVMGRLAPSVRDRIRWHVLHCDPCCLHVVNTAEFIQALRDALHELPRA